MARIWNGKDWKMNEELIHKELSGKIIGAAMTVLNELRPVVRSAVPSAPSALSAVELETVMQKELV